MTLSDEYKLYHRNRIGWCNYVAPRWRDLFLAHPERKRAMWDEASPVLRAALKALAATILEAR